MDSLKFYMPNVAATKMKQMEEQECQNNDECILTPSLNQFREIFVNRRKPLRKCASFRSFLSSFLVSVSFETLQMLVIDCILCCRFLSLFWCRFFSLLCMCPCVKCLLLCHSIRFDSFYCGWLQPGWLPQSYTIICIRCILFFLAVFLLLLQVGESFEGNLSLAVTLFRIRSTDSAKWI